MKLLKSSPASDQAPCPGMREWRARAKISTRSPGRSREEETRSGRKKKKEKKQRQGLSCILPCMHTCVCICLYKLAFAISQSKHSENSLTQPAPSVSSLHCILCVHPCLCLVTAEGLAFGLSLQQNVYWSVLDPKSNVLEFVVALDPWCFNRNRETLAAQLLSKTSYFDRNSLRYDPSQLFFISTHSIGISNAQADKLRPRGQPGCPK